MEEEPAAVLLVKAHVKQFAAQKHQQQGQSRIIA
jgi:hypothetical protein